MGETESELQKLYIVARLRNKVGWYESRKSRNKYSSRSASSWSAGSAGCVGYSVHDIRNSDTAKMGLGMYLFARTIRQIRP